MLKIPLIKSKKYAIIDDQDAPLVCSHKWYLHRDGWACGFGPNGKHIKMAHLIQPVPKGFLCDHKNRDKLDNRRENLRIATKSQNSQNRVKPRRGNLLFKGVRFHKQTNTWQAAIVLNKKKISLRYHATQELAARAYDKAAIQYFGEFACLNFPQSANPPADSPCRTCEHGIRI